MSIKLDAIKSQINDLVKIIEDIQDETGKEPLTKQEFLEFLRKVKEKNSLVIEEIDTLMDTGGFDLGLF
ncbi:MAG: hypothetical protein IJV86_02560 [Clostridia bacterium]|nr:hypothetical protein [Clostridia bacterium]